MAIKNQLSRRKRKKVIICEKENETEVREYMYAVCTLTRRLRGKLNTELTLELEDLVPTGGTTKSTNLQRGSKGFKIVN